MIGLVIFATILATIAGVMCLSCTAIGGDPFHFLKPKVELTLYDGEKLISRMYKENGKQYSYFSAAFKIRKVYLNDDGTTGREEDSVFGNIFTHWRKL